MDEYIGQVNADPFVLANTDGNGLTFTLLPNQQTAHLHQADWRPICAALNLLTASPLILVGHSNGAPGRLYVRPMLRMLLETTLAVLHGQTNLTVINGAEPSLQSLATKSHVVIELETATFSKTLNP